MRNYLYRLFYNKCTALTVLVVIMALSLLFGTGAAFGQLAPEPQTDTNTNTEINTGFQPEVQNRLIEAPAIQYIEVPVVEVKYVEKVKGVPIKLRNFSNIEELGQWLVDMNTKTTIVYLNRPEHQVDCDDFASTLQEKAMEAGYMISFQIIEPGRYNSLFKKIKMPPNTLHAINLAIIGNEAYYIEPQTGEIVLAAQLD